MRLFLCGDVMTGRGIDQALPHPANPILYEPYVRDAREYVHLAEKAHGPIPRRSRSITSGAMRCKNWNGPKSIFESQNWRPPLRRLKRHGPAKGFIIGCTPRTLVVSLPHISAHALWRTITCWTGDTTDCPKRCKR